MRPALRFLFLDVGGVLLTNGWDHHSRRRAAAQFKLEWPELESRHRLIFETYEAGKLTLDEYLGWLVFYKKRSFTRVQFKRFMLDQSNAYPKMINLIVRLKERYGFKIAVVSNEAREINEYRIEKFKLTRLADFFISSCFVHLRKPDAEIFRLALDIAQVPVDQVLYIDNTSLFVDVAESLGIRSILHEDYTSTRMKLKSIGLDFYDEQENTFSGFAS
jgi:putative hydrolase of the HAD superfamily